MLSHSHFVLLHAALMASLFIVGAAYNLDETLNTLKYAHRARNIQNRPIAQLTSISDLSSDKEPNPEIVQQIEEMHKEVEELRKQLLNAKMEAEVEKICENCAKYEQRVTGLEEHHAEVLIWNEVETIDTDQH